MPPGAFSASPSPQPGLDAASAASSFIARLQAAEREREEALRSLQQMEEDLRFVRACKQAVQRERDDQVATLRREAEDYSAFVQQEREEDAAESRAFRLERDK